MFNSNERMIFSYRAGDREIFADPMELARRIVVAFQGDPNDTIAKMQPQQGQDPVAVLPLICMATDKFIAGVREAFKLAPFDPSTGAGTLESEVREVWNHYQEWLEKKSPTPDPSLT